jgi:hypothetical protein
VRLQIHRSINAGASANYIFSGISDAGTNNANFIAPFILDPNNNNVMLAGGVSLWRSSNVTAATPAWSAIKSPANPPSPISAISMRKGSPRTIWVGHNNGSIYRTVNGTLATPTWVRIDVPGSPLPHRFCTRIRLDPATSRIVYAAFGGYTTGNIWQSQNSGATWKNIAATLPPAPVYDVAIHPSNSQFLYAATEVGVFASEDSGVTWSPTNQGPTNCSVNELFWMNKVLVAVTHGRGVFRIDLSQPTPVAEAGAAEAGDDDGPANAYEAASSPASASEAPAVPGGATGAPATVAPAVEKATSPANTQ